MNTRRYRDTPEGDDSGTAQSYLMSVRDKLRQHKVKPETIMEKCKIFDVNGDNIVHADDLIDVLFDLLPRNVLSKRELHHLVAALTHDSRKGNIAYLRIDEVLEGSASRGQPRSRGRAPEMEERWLDDSNLVRDEQWAVQRGSVGEWLVSAGCPAERQNFRCLIDCLENFERETGMRIEQSASGFVIPLGPNLRAQLDFQMSK
jgi:hypothetical protein